MRSTTILVLAVFAGLAAPLPAQRRRAKAPPADLATLWKAIQKVDIDDTADIDWRRGKWITSAREDHPYKILYTNGETAYAKKRPKDDRGVKKLWQRRFSRETYLEYGTGKTYDRYWAEMTWVAEERK